MSVVICMRRTKQELAKLRFMLSMLFRELVTVGIRTGGGGFKGKNMDRSEISMSEVRRRL